MKTAYVLVGVPGAGKSTYARKLNLPHFSSDSIRLELFGSLRQNHSKEDDEKVFQILHDRVFKYHESLIFDATNIERKTRIPLYDELKKNGFHVEIHLVLEPLELAIFQNQRREFEKIVPNFVIEDKYKFMVAPRIGVDCDSFKIISQSSFLKRPTSYQKFVQYAKDHGIVKCIYEYVNAAYLQEFKNLDSGHDTPYHLESVSEHIDMCIKNSNDDLMLITSILHDLGKSLAKNGGHYKGHDTISSIYALRFFDEIKDVPQHINPSDVIEIVVQHMLAHKNLPKTSIERNKIDDSLLNDIYRFRDIDEISRITDIKQNRNE